MKIVITGGQVAGKTTVLNLLRERLPKLVPNVKFIDETAIDVINTFVDLDLVDFTSQQLQKAIFKKQKAIEDSLGYYDIVIMDRSLRDGLAYLPEFYQDKQQSIEINKYDAIIFLETLAVNEELYNRHSSETNRLGDREKALEDSRNLRNVYKGHNRFIDIGLKDTIEELYSTVLAEVFKLCHLEVEKKFLVTDAEASNLAQLLTKKANCSSLYTIHQKYLTKNIRARCLNSVYSLDIKSDYLDGRSERNLLITKDEFTEIPGHSILKDRIDYKFDWGSVSMDYYKEPLMSDKIIVEIETTCPMEAIMNSLGLGCSQLAPIEYSNYNLWRNINDR